MKHCPRCNTDKPLTEFSRDKSKSDGRCCECKVCAYERAKKWRAKNPAKIRQYKRGNYERHRERKRAAARVGYLAQKYGLSPDDYERLLAQQGGVCAICGLPPNGKTLVVDHCHVSGVVRGLLHDWCNGALGFVEKVGLDSVERYLHDAHSTVVFAPERVRTGG